MSLPLACEVPFELLEGIVDELMDEELRTAVIVHKAASSCDPAFKDEAFRDILHHAAGRSCRHLVVSEGKFFTKGKPGSACAVPTQAVLGCSFSVTTLCTSLIQRRATLRPANHLNLLVVSDLQEQLCQYGPVVKSAASHCPSSKVSVHLLPLHFSTEVVAAASARLFLSTLRRLSP